MYLFNFVTSNPPKWTLSAKSISEYGWEFIKSKNLNNNTFLEFWKKRTLSVNVYLCLMVDRVIGLKCNTFLFMTKIMMMMTVVEKNWKGEGNMRLLSIFAVQLYGYESQRLLVITWPTKLFFEVGQGQVERKICVSTNWDRGSHVCATLTVSVGVLQCSKTWTNSQQGFLYGRRLDVSRIQATIAAFCQHSTTAVQLTDTHWRGRGRATLWAHKKLTTFNIMRLIYDTVPPQDKKTNKPMASFYA